jgi:hypothetical protein
MTDPAAIPAPRGTWIARTPGGGWVAGANLLSRRTLVAAIAVFALGVTVAWLFLRKLTTESESLDGLRWGVLLVGAGLFQLYIPVHLKGKVVVTVEGGRIRVRKGLGFLGSEREVEPSGLEYAFGGRGIGSYLPPDRRDYLIAVTRAALSEES